MNEQPEKLPPIYITFSANRWYAWAADVPMTLLAAKNKSEAITQSRAIAEQTGREWGGRQRTAKQVKRKAKRRRQRKAEAVAAANRDWAEFDELDDTDYLDAVMGI